ncbi:MAG: hypothetical protein ACM31C_11515 [Acidobacteriota bacterium]
MMWVTSVVCAWIAAQSIAEMSIEDAVMSVAIAAVGVFVAVRARSASGRLRRVWRDGRLIEVTVIDWNIGAGRWRATIVECEGRRGVVGFTRAPDVGMKLPALEHGDQLAVLERNKVLRIGKISPRQC